jgi:acetyl/propionyl-CoA carboxylase alpha subunit
LQKNVGGGGRIGIMTEDQAHNIKEIYDKAIAELEELGFQKQVIIKRYISKLEEQKIQALKSSLGLLDNQS